MHCFSRDQLRGYLLRQLDAQELARVEDHVSECSGCCGTLEALASDDLVQEYFEASQRDSDTGSRTARSASNVTAGGPPEPLDWAALAWDDPQLPRQFDRFILKQVIGSGGFGVVYRADDINLRREVAVKIPHLGGHSPSIRQRFLQEGAAAANLHHPHIVQVHQSGAEGGVCFLVAEYCPGQTLRELLSESPGGRAAREAATIVLVLAEAVAHAHQNGIVHRDIKPSNVILDSRGDHQGLPYCPKLTDFGTAKFLGAEQALTTEGTLIGTAPYMAPEQIKGDREVGPACDIYALGVLLYEMITGQVPIQGADKADTIHKVVTVEPPLLHAHVRSAPRDLSAICRCCLEKQPEQRYASARELAADLQRFLNNEPTTARPLSGGRGCCWTRRNPLPLSIMGAISLIFALSLGGLAWHAAQLNRLNQQLIESNRQALEMKDRAEQSERHARRMQYASDIRLAAKSWARVISATPRIFWLGMNPVPTKNDLRGMEWRFLSHAVRPSSDAISEAVRLALPNSPFAGPESLRHRRR